MFSAQCLCNELINTVSICLQGWRPACILWLAPALPMVAIVFVYSVGSAPDKCLAGRGTRKFGWRNRNIRLKTSTGPSVVFTPSNLAGKATLSLADAGNFTRTKYRRVSQHTVNQFKSNYDHTEYQHQIKRKEVSLYSMGLTNENALWN